MRSNDEILAMPSFALTPEEQQRKRVLEDKRNEEVQIEAAYLNGKIDALKGQLLADKGLREDLRIGQWANQDNHGISYDRATETFSNVPDGWPEGIDDPDEFVREWVNIRLDAPATNKQQQPEASPGVAAFRKSIGD